MKRKMLALLLASSMVASVALLSAGCGTKTATSATDDAEGAPVLWAPGESRDKIVVISDLHLGSDDTYTEPRATRRVLIAGR